MYQEDTIAAISTALGQGAISIVRLSGENAIEIANRISKSKDLSQVASHTIHYGHIIDPQIDQVIDEVMITIMRAPKTYTREDIVEINCHGGIIAVQRILEVVLDAGARLAEPGEFTKRAFLNGRIDLSQAEAVMDLIEAKSRRAMDASLGQLQGSLSQKIRDLREEMLQTLAQVEVTIDYPEYDEVETLSSQELKVTAEKVKSKILVLLQQASTGKIFREGIKTAIIGKPNVGKSSLLNRLTGMDTAIVTDIAGTTRDTVEEYVNLRGVPLHLVDTAGIRQSSDIVEQLGVERSKKAMNQADLIILILNQSEPLGVTDHQLFQATQDKKRIVLLNKSDLASQIDVSELSPYLDPSTLISVSILEEKGLDLLEQQIEDYFFSGNLEQSEANYLLNTRHTSLLKQAVQALDEVLEGLDLALPVDLIQIDFTRAWDLLGEITGESVQDELLDKLFSQFCLGK